jgi:S-DNA-T family DNA segregation ATPase FtsK/SpoIIIE
MRLGYNKAAKIIERMEREGLVGPANGVKPRQVLMRGATPGEATPMPNV